MVEHLPSTSALARSVHGGKAEWSTTEHLLASAVDALNAANWQRTGKKGNKPKPIPRPGEGPAKSERQFGTASLPVDEAKEFFDRVNRRTKPAEVPQVRTCAECDRFDIHARGLCRAHYMRWWRESKS